MNAGVSLRRKRRLVCESAPSRPLLHQTPAVRRLHLHCFPAESPQAQPPPAAPAPAPGAAGARRIESGGGDGQGVCQPLPQGLGEGGGGAMLWVPWTAAAATSPPQRDGRAAAADSEEHAPHVRMGYILVRAVGPPPPPLPPERLSTPGAVAPTPPPKIFGATPTLPPKILPPTAAQAEEPRAPGGALVSLLPCRAPQPLLLLPPPPLPARGAFSLGHAAPENSTGRGAAQAQGPAAQGPSSSVSLASPSMEVPITSPAAQQRLVGLGTGGRHVWHHASVGAFTESGNPCSPFTSGFWSNIYPNHVNDTSWFLL
jgi:hypothetical protein